VGMSKENKAREEAEKVVKVFYSKRFVSYKEAQTELARIAEQALLYFNKETSDELERYRALHEEELGVCEQHCDVVQEQKKETERLKGLIDDKNWGIQKNIDKIKSLEKKLEELESKNRKQENELLLARNLIGESFERCFKDEIVKDLEKKLEVAREALEKDDFSKLEQVLKEMGE